MSSFPGTVCRHTAYIITSVPIFLVCVFCILRFLAPETDFNCLVLVGNVFSNLTAHVWEIRPHFSRDPSWSHSLRTNSLLFLVRVRDHFREHLQGRSLDTEWALSWRWAIAKQHRLLQARNSCLQKIRSIIRELAVITQNHHIHDRQ